MGFNLVSLVVTIRAVDAPRLRSTLPLQGTAYATTCRNLSCLWPERPCETCSRRESCDWHLVFGQKLSSDPAALKRHQKPPLPFAFSFPAGEILTNGHNEIECGLVVIGPAIPHLHMLLEGFVHHLANSMGAASEIIRIACRDYQGFLQTQSEIHQQKRSGSLVPDNLVITSTEGLLESRTWDNSDLRIQLLSPLRLFEDGRPVSRFDFGRFARSIMRRVSAMAYYYGESEFNCDFKELSRQVESVVCTDDHFRAANGTHRKISGIAGYGSFSGNFSGLMPFLVIGSYIHTGKGSSFGMGGYKLLPELGKN